MLLLARQVSREAHSVFATPLLVILPGLISRFSGAGRVTRAGRVTIFTGVVLGSGDAGGGGGDGGGGLGFGDTDDGGGGLGFGDTGEGGEEGSDARGNATPLGAFFAAETSGVCRGLVVPVGA